MKRHETDTLSLVFGLLFLACVVCWLIGFVFKADVPGLLVGAIVLIGVGLIGLLTAIPRRRTATVAANSGESASIGDHATVGTDGAAENGTAGEPEVTESGADGTQVLPAVDDTAASASAEGTDLHKRRD